MERIHASYKTSMPEIFFVGIRCAADPLLPSDRVQQGTAEKEQ